MLNDNELKELTERKNKKAAAQQGPLNDEALAEVAGGSYFYPHIVDNPDDVRFIFHVGDIVEVDTGLYFFTTTCRVVWTGIYDEATCGRSGYEDIYLVESVNYQRGDFNYVYTWVSRDDIKIS